MNDELGKLLRTKVNQCSKNGIQALEALSRSQRLKAYEKKEIIFNEADHPNFSII